MPTLCLSHAMTFNNINSLAVFGPSSNPFYGQQFGLHQVTSRKVLKQCTSYLSSWGLLKVGVDLVLNLLLPPSH